MGIEAFLVSSSLVGVVGQRLVLGHARNGNRGAYHRNRDADCRHLPRHVADQAADREQWSDWDNEKDMDHNLVCIYLTINRA